MRGLGAKGLAISKRKFLQRKTENLLEKKAPNPPTPKKNKNKKSSKPFVLWLIFIFDAKKILAQAITQLKKKKNLSWENIIPQEITHPPSRSKKQ